MARPTAEDILAAYRSLAACVARLEQRWAPPLTPAEEGELSLDVVEAFAGQREPLATLQVAADWRTIATYSTQDLTLLLRWHVARREQAEAP